MVKLCLPAHVRCNFAVVVPAYDEVENVPELVRELRSTFERFELGGEVLLVDDGSSDATADVALREGKDWPGLKVLRHSRNLGKTEALLTAAGATQAEWLVLFDADLQHSTDDIPRFLERLAMGSDIVTGRKVGHYPKQLVSILYNRVSRLLFRVPVSDLNSMKAFRRSILGSVSLRHDWHRFLVVLAYARGFSATEIDITLYPRRHGRSKYTGPRRILFALLDLVVVAASLLIWRRSWRQRPWGASRLLRQI